MERSRIALYPGNGIGPEVLDQAVRALGAPADCIAENLKDDCS